MGDNEGNRQLSTAEMKKHVDELERQAQAEREKAGARTGRDREVEQEDGGKPEQLKEAQQQAADRSRVPR